MIRHSNSYVLTLVRLMVAAQSPVNNPSLATTAQYIVDYITDDELQEELFTVIFGVLCSDSPDSVET